MGKLHVLVTAWPLNQRLGEVTASSTCTESSDATSRPHRALPARRSVLKAPAHP